MRILALVTDAFGGKGGIAHYNRSLLMALCAYAACDEVVALPRAAPSDVGILPPKLRFVTAAAAGKTRYALAVAREVAIGGRFDAVFCGHLNLLPLAWLASRLCRAPLVLQTYGIDAFERPRRALNAWLARTVDLCITISRTTRARFLDWSGVDPARCTVLPPTFEETRFQPGPGSEVLRQQFRLEGKKVLLIVGRLDPRERYKGHDTILRVLPDLLRSEANLAFVIAGEGGDRARLESLAREIGVEHVTRFAGAVPDVQLPGLYRLADVFAMPSTGEGFGIVFLEAVASGVPVVAGDRDGARDALRDGTLGILVDAGNPEQVKAGILTALRTPSPERPGFACFGFGNFSRQLHNTLARRIMQTSTT